MNSSPGNPSPSGPPGPLNPLASAAVAGLPPGVVIRQALANDVAAIHVLLRPYVAQRLLLSRTEAELIELTRHGFVAECTDPANSDPANSSSPPMAPRQPACIGFSAVEIYSPKLAELQSLAVHHEYRRTGIGRHLVRACVERARDLGVMEVLAISSSEDFLQSCGFDYALPDQKKALFCQLRPRH